MPETCRKSLELEYNCVVCDIWAGTGDQHVLLAKFTWGRQTQTNKGSSVIETSVTKEEKQPGQEKKTKLTLGTSARRFIVGNGVALREIDRKGGARHGNLFRRIARFKPLRGIFKRRLVGVPHLAGGIHARVHVVGGAEVDGRGVALGLSVEAGALSGREG